MNIRNVIFIIFSAYNAINASPINIPLQIQNNLKTTVKIKTNVNEYAINGGGFVTLNSLPQEIHVKKVHELYLRHNSEKIQQALNYIKNELSRVPANATDVTALMVIEPGEDIFHPFGFSYMNHSASHTGISYRIPQ